MSGDDSLAARPGAPGAAAGASRWAGRFSLAPGAFEARIAQLPHPVASRYRDDLYLAMSCAEGDEAAWRECVTGHRAFLVQFAARLIGAAAGADLVDEVIADLWTRRRLAQYQGRSALRTWLAAVVAHAALNTRRRGERTVSESEISPPHPVALPAIPGREGDLSRALQGAIASLAPPLRLLVLLYYEQGLTLDEAGRILGRSKSRLSRMLKGARDVIRARADAIARRDFGRPLTALRDDADLGSLDLDLRSACRERRDETSGMLSKRQDSSADE
jgi:RNA polymerase sigma factor (sigma-70 family)